MGIGTHISKVKSVSIDDWKPEWINTCRNIGNDRAKAFYEHSVPPGVKYNSKVEISGGDRVDVQEAKKLEAWIRAKYESKEFAPPVEDEPHVRLARGESIGDGLGKEEKQKKQKSGDGGKKEKQDDGGDEKRKKEKKEKKASAQFPKAFATLEPWATQGFDDAD